MWRAKIVWTETNQSGTFHVALFLGSDTNVCWFINKLYNRLCSHLKGWTWAYRSKGRVKLSSPAKVYFEISSRAQQSPMWKVTKYCLQCSCTQKLLTYFVSGVDFCLRIQTFNHSKKKYIKFLTSSLSLLVFLSVVLLPCYTLSKVCVLQAQ